MGPGFFNLSVCKVNQARIQFGHAPGRSEKEPYRENAKDTVCSHVNYPVHTGVAGLQGYMAMRLYIAGGKSVPLIAAEGVLSEAIGATDGVSDVCSSSSLIRLFAR